MLERCLVVNKVHSLIIMFLNEKGKIAYLQNPLFQIVEMEIISRDRLPAIWFLVNKKVENNFPSAAFLKNDCQDRHFHSIVQYASCGASQTTNHADLP